MTISNAARRLADRLHDLAHAGGHEDDVIGPLAEFIDGRIAAHASTSPSLDAFVAAAKRGAESVVDVPRRNAVPLPAPPSLTQIAEDIYECAMSHEPAVRLIGNVRADQVAAVASRFIDGQLKQAAVDAAEKRIAHLERSVEELSTIGLEQGRRLAAAQQRVEEGLRYEEAQRRNAEDAAESRAAFEAKAVVLAQAAKAYQDAARQWFGLAAHLGYRTDRVEEVGHVLSKALEPFAALIARTK